MRDTERACRFLSSLKGPRFLPDIFRSVCLRSLTLSQPYRTIRTCQLKTWCIIHPLNPVTFAFPYHSAQAATDLIIKQVLHFATLAHAGALISPNQSSGVNFGGTRVMPSHPRSLSFLPSTSVLITHISIHDAFLSLPQKSCFKMLFHLRPKGSLMLQPCTLPHPPGIQSTKYN